MRGSVFISYARTDKRFAEALSEVLSDFDYEVWWDDHLVGGEDFRATILDRLDRANVVIVLWSHASVQSQWVIDEAERGMRNGTLLPVALEDVDPASIPLGLKRAHHLSIAELADARRGGFKRKLLEAVLRLERPPGSTSAYSRRTGQRQVHFMWGAIFVAVISIGIAYWAADTEALVACEGEESFVTHLGKGDDQRAFASAILRYSKPLMISESSGRGGLSSIFSICTPKASEQPGYELYCNAEREGDQINLHATMKTDSMHYSHFGTISVSSGAYSVESATVVGSRMDDALVERSIFETDIGHCKFRRRVMGIAL